VTMRVQDWHQVKRLEAESKPAQALDHALRICRVCQRYLLVDGCHGCHLKQLRQKFTVKIVELKDVKTSELVEYERSSIQRQA
jgi:hypothetical protein